MRTRKSPIEFNGHVRVTDGVGWLSYSYDMGDRKLHFSQYLVEAAGTSFLIEAGAGNEQEMLEAIDAGTGGDGPDVLLFTSSTLPHTENYRVIDDEWSEIEAMSATYSPNQVGLQGTAPKVVNDTKEIGGGTFSFIDPLLTDIVASNWVYSHGTKTLFTAEGLGHYHARGAETALSGDLEDGIPYGMIHRFNADKLTFLRYVDPAKLRSAFDAVFEEFAVEYVAPVHGNPVEPDDVDSYIDRVIRSVENAGPPP